MRSRRFSFLAGWLAVGVLAAAGFAAFGAPGPTAEEVRLEAAAASIGHASGAYAGLGFVQLGAESDRVTIAVQPAEPGQETEENAALSTTAEEEETTMPDTGWLSEVEVRALVSLYFKPADVNRAVRVAWCESRFDPKATDHRSGAVGLFKHLPKYWPERAEQAGFPGASPTDPEASVAAAAWAVYNDGGWDIFPCTG
ncbi:MAG TPA: transglycosylase SLT domain-containing protein [Acidimicrobiia bacterium]